MLIQRRVQLRQPQKRHIQATAVVHIEVVGNVVNRFRIRAGPQAYAAYRHTTNGASFNGQGGLGRESFLVRHACHTVRHSDPQVNQRARR